LSTVLLTAVTQKVIRAIFCSQTVVNSDQVVTNAIVLLDLVEQYRERGLPLQEALIEGGRHRLRPILMTAVATMLALAPLAFSGNSGGGFIGAPLAVVVIGGLFTSTLLTLILVPVLYSLARRLAAGGGH
jgi:hydrophobic/amphiphilic exporter-1 (mainly G- bacteria), HAE1 family